MATTAPRKTRSQEFLFEWTGKDRQGKVLRGHMRAPEAAHVQTSLYRQGIMVTRLKKRSLGRGKKVRPKDIALLTRQMATMMKAGVPLLQSFDIVARGNPSPRITQLLGAIRQDVETGTALNAAFRKHPLHFSSLYCNLIEAGEAAGILDAIMDRLASHLEKTEAIQRKIKSALFYPCAVIVVAWVVVSVMMIFVVPAFKEVFTSFGADLPLPTVLLIAISDFLVRYGWLLAALISSAIYAFWQTWKHRPTVQHTMDRWLLRLPILGALLQKACIARWTRTLSTMFAAGVPLVEALESVSGAAGNHVYQIATERIQQDVATGTSLTMAMEGSRVFPSMVLQMSAIGEESGALDHMLSKAADFYEAEVDDLVAALSSLMEPIIIVVLGALIGGIVIAMYLPIFKLGHVF